MRMPRLCRTRLTSRVGMRGANASPVYAAVDGEEVSTISVRVLRVRVIHVVP
jgi:hypothetical protein